MHNKVVNKVIGDTVMDQKTVKPLQMFYLLLNCTCHFKHDGMESYY